MSMDFMEQMADAGKSEYISPLQDPFNRSGVTKVFVIAYAPGELFMNESWRITGSIQFRRGKTKGEQDFEAATLGELLTTMGAFLTNLNE